MRRIRLFLRFDMKSKSCFYACKGIMRIFFFDFVYKSIRDVIGFRDGHGQMGTG